MRIDEEFRGKVLGFSIPVGLCNCGCGASLPYREYKVLRFVDGHQGRRPLLAWFAKYIDFSGNCWEWHGHRWEQGYGCVWQGRRRIKVHRAVFEITFGPIPKSVMVLHECDNPPCVRPSHLFKGNALANVLDCIRKGRRANGERHPKAKLTENQVVDILKLCAHGNETDYSIAKAYGLSPNSITMIRQGNSWRHIPRPESIPCG